LYTLRFTALNAETAAILQQAAKDGPLSPGQVVELDYLKFSVVSRQPGEPSQPGAPGAGWAAATSYADLSASLLLARDPAPRRVSLRFASPTTFKSGGKHLPFPLPELVFGSLLERWNAFAPIAFPPEARRYASECLAVSRYKLSSHTVPGKGGGLRIGAVGEVTYTSLNYDRYWMSLVGVLAAFSIFAGVGATTTQGLGQCRLA
jgi:CRISPR-associated endoribonuclease Cas6